MRSCCHLVGSRSLIIREKEISKPTKKYSLSNLDPIIDSKGLLRVGGRLSRSKMYLDSKYQIVMHKDFKVSNLLVRHVHSSVGHLGKNTILAELRKKYWIVNASTIIKINAS